MVKRFDVLKKMYVDGWFKNSLQKNFTPYNVVNNMIDCIDLSASTLVCNIEFAVILIKERGVKPRDITAWADTDEKKDFYFKLGINLFLEGDCITEKHISIYKNKIKIGKKKVKKFKNILMNPAYDKGLLTPEMRKTLPICNTGNILIDKAARIRIDSVFVVYCYENLLKENGIMVTVWPYSWTQGPQWENFRKWMRCSGLKEIAAIEHSFEGIKSNTAITVQQKSYIGSAAYINKYRSSNLKIDWNYDIIPNCYGEIGFSIFEKEQNYKDKITMIMFKEFDFTTHKYFLMLSTATGTSNVSCAISSNISELPRCEFPANVIKDNDFHKTNKSPAIPVILFISVEHKERFRSYHNSNLYNFILHQRKADFHNTTNNVGSMPDIIKNMIGIYTDAKAYKVLGLSTKEIKHIEETVGLPIIK